MMRRRWMAMGWLVWGAGLAQAACLNPEVLHVALIPKNAQSVQEQAQAPLLQALHESTGKPVQMLPVASYAAVIESLLTGQAQVAELGPAGYALLAKRSTRFVPFATLSNSHEVGRYHSLLVVRADAGIRDIQGLRGRALALTDPSSTSGAVVPELAVAQLTGYKLGHFFARVVFMGSHDKALAAVREGKAQAAFVASSQLDEADPAWRVLWRSPALVGSPFLLDATLCPALQHAVRQAFLAKQAQLQPWLRIKNYRQVVPVTAQDYAGIQSLLTGAP